MHKTTWVVGIDPGLVHTGVVALGFYPKTHSVRVRSTVVNGIQAVLVSDWIDTLMPEAIFIEGYRPRSHLGTDQRMVEGVAALRTETDGTVLLNHGVKKVVTKDLMQLLGVWDFAVTTHHQDLRSAARIALLGMLKDDDMNALLTQVVKDHLSGVGWAIHYP